LLGEDYLKKFDEILLNFNDPTVNIITNFSIMTPYFFTDHTELSVSFDFSARQSHEEVMQNLLTSPKDVAILILATPRVIKMNVDDMIATLNTIKSVKSVEIKPYSTNQANQHNVSHSMYEEFVRKWVVRKNSFNFNFTNLKQLDKSITGERSAYSDDHIYITPKGRFAVLDFDSQDHEFFKELDSFDEYIEWTDAEKSLVTMNQFCSSCTYLGSCLTEHYRQVSDMTNSCNGYRHLIDWYKGHLAKEL
jgi:hypothetical protein